MTQTVPSPRLGAAHLSVEHDPPNEQTVQSYRASAEQSVTADRLGPLADLPGYWEGTGFSLIARPDSDPANEDGFFLQLNLLRESIAVTPIGSPVPNRGSAQPDVDLFGVTYLWRVTDDTTGSALHIEPGVFLTVPETTEPASPPSIARLSTIPHGNALCAVGPWESVDPTGPMQIPPLNTAPFPTGGQPPPPGTPPRFRAYDLSQPTPYRTAPLPVGITQALVDDPETMQRAAQQGQRITHLTVLHATTTDGVASIPFITANADTRTFTSIFAIEHVVGPAGREFLQLQYSQTALLEFRGMCFPHVTVGTLIKAF